MTTNSTEQNDECAGVRSIRTLGRMRRVTNDTNPRLTTEHRRVPTNDGVSRPTWTPPTSTSPWLNRLNRRRFQGEFQVIHWRHTVKSVYVALPPFYFAQTVEPFQHIIFFPLACAIHDMNRRPSLRQYEYCPILIIYQNTIHGASKFTAAVDNNN